MFQLKFSPDFATQRKALLAETEIPDVEIPTSVEDCLDRMTQTGLVSRSTLGNRQLWAEVLRAARPLLLKAALISTLASVCIAGSTVMAMRLIHPDQSLKIMLLLSLACFILNALAQVAIFNSGRLRVWVSLSAETYLAGLVSKKILRLSSLAAAQQSSGNLKILVTSDVKNIGNFLENTVRNLIPVLTALVVITPILIHLTGKAGLFGIVIMVLILPIALVLNQISIHYQDRSQKELDSLTSLIGEWVKNIRLIRYLSWDQAFSADVAGSVRNFMKVSVAQHFMACLIFGLGVSWWMVSIAGVILVARAFQYPLDLVAFFGSVWLLTFLAGYFNHLPNTIRLYGIAAPSMKRIARFLSEEEQSAFFKPEDTALLENSKPLRVIFENVSFQYPDGHRSVQHLSAVMDLRRKTAVIGEVGCGKTTFLKLLCGELAPTEGRILIEFEEESSGKIQTQDLWGASAYHQYRRSLAYVPQEPFISSDLLHRNISLGAEPEDEPDSPASQASHAKLMASAYWAELEADIAALPQGLSQEIGESGVNLSGGQRQRLNLARAYHSERDFFVLDDTLSAVDTKTEVQLMDRLSSLAQGFVLVTHRTGELMRVEEIWVMKEGNLVERGVPQELIRNPDSHFQRVLNAYEVHSDD